MSSDAPADGAFLRRHRLKAVLGGALVVWLMASLGFALTQVPPTVALPTDVDQVVIFGVPGLTFADLRSGDMPRLASIAASGAVAGANVRTGGNRASIPEAYATLGAGFRISSGSTGATAVDVPRSNGGSGNAVQVVDMPPRSVVGGRAGEGRPGALGDALDRANMTTAVVSNADVLAKGDRSDMAPAALAVADSKGRVDGGTVAASLTTAAPDAPGYLRADLKAFERSIGHATSKAAVVMIDPGATTRLALAPTPAHRRAALKETDALIGAAAAKLDRHAVLFVVGVTPPTSTWALTPVVATGATLQRGHLHSPSTHRRDFITLADLAPTTLSLLGVPVPGTMSGHVLRNRPGSTSLSAISALNDMLVSRRSTDTPLTLVFILFQSLLYVVAIGMLLRSGIRSRFGTAVMFAVLTCAAWPLATFLMRADLRASTLGAWTFVISWGLAVAIAAGASRFRAHPLDPLLAICGATVATIVVDLSTGAHLQYGSFFGYAPNKGTRFTGLGNAAFALLASATVVVCTALVARARRRIDGWWLAAAVAACVVAADGAPWMGADVGGILSIVPTFGLLLWALRGRAIRWRSILVAIGATVAVLAVAVGLDALRAPDQRTHMSRFFLDFGNSGLVHSTIGEKWTENMRLLRESMWAWFVPITVAFSFIALTVGNLWHRALPVGSPYRIGVMATLALGLVAWLLNDSGIVVVALASMYLGPYVLLLARSDNPPESHSDALDNPVPQSGTT